MGQVRTYGKSLDPFIYDAFFQSLDCRSWEQFRKETGFSKSDWAEKLMELQEEIEKVDKAMVEHAIRIGQECERRNGRVEKEFFNEFNELRRSKLILL